MVTTNGSEKFDFLKLFWFVLSFRLLFIISEDFTIGKGCLEKLKFNYNSNLPNVLYLVIAYKILLFNKW